MALDLSELNKNKKSVIRYSDKKERTLAPFESNPVEIGKKTVPESKAEKEYKRLEKLEEKTEKLLNKAQKIEARANLKESEQLTINNAQTSNKLAIKSPQTHHKRKRKASYFAYICLPPRKLPRKILNHVKDNAFKDEQGQWFSKIDTYELKEKTEINSHQTSNTIRQLRDEGFFEILEASTSGFRVLKIDPEIYGLS